MNASRRVELLGCPLDLLTSPELLDELKHRIREKAAPAVIQFVNANKVAMVHRDPAMGEILRQADYVLADGQPMVPMAAALGIRVPERIDGIGLMQALLAFAETERFTVYLFGARQDVLEECVHCIQKQFPNLAIAGYRNGYFKPEELPTIAGSIRKQAPDFLFLGMGSPTKERLAQEWKDRFGAAVIQGVGGSFDVIAGRVQRAPVWLQRVGLEWLYRVAQEPRRMFWRYAQTNGLCLWVFAKSMSRRWLTPWLGRDPSRNP